MTDGAACRVIRDFAELTELEQDWWQLWHVSRSATPFQSPAWLLPWWRAFAPGELCVFAVRGAGRLAALAPFYREMNSGSGRLLPLGISVSDYHDVLVAPDLAEGALAALASEMARCAWDDCELCELPPDSVGLQIAGPLGCVETVELASACPVLSLPECIDDLPRAFPPRKRRALRMVRNRAERCGELQIIAANAETAVDDFDQLLRLHGARWESRGETGVLADERVQQFHRAAVTGLQSAGILRLYTLRIAGEAVAAYYGFQHGHRGYGYLTGFDPAYQSISPSALLLGHAIAQAAREGGREFHFLRGREPYKYHWGAIDRWNRRRVFRRNALARAS